MSKTTKQPEPTPKPKTPAKKVSTATKKPVSYMEPLPERPKPKRDKRLKNLHKPKRHIFWRLAAWFGVVLGFMVGAYLVFALLSTSSLRQSRNILTRLARPSDPAPKFGRLLSAESVVSFDATTTKQLIAQTNKTYAASVTSGITKQVVRYSSSDEEGREISVYARVYMPASVANGATLPVFAFAPGTTGIDDHCAASLEKPAVANWANYDSLLAAYAAQGYIVVTTDYEGMRDSSRMHHYMVGVQEGRAMLDSVRVLKNLPSTKGVADMNSLFLSGYSQGGHAALWADTIAPDYAQELKPKGLVGFGPVSDVQTTLSDITKGANINWFGPFILAAYQDYYRKSYGVGVYLLPKWQQSLTSDIASQCINTVIPHWGKVPAAIYQPDFIAALIRGDLSGNYSDLASDLAKNRAGTVATPTAKLINHGQRDNVVLPSQSESLRRRLCGLGNGSVTLKIYPSATHYDTMVQSFNDTIAWMNAVGNGQAVPSSCQQ